MDINNEPYTNKMGMRIDMNGNFFIIYNGENHLIGKYDNGKIIIKNRDNSLLTKNNSNKGKYQYSLYNESESESESETETEYVREKNNFISREEIKRRIVGIGKNNHPEKFKNENGKEHRIYLGKNYIGKLDDLIEKYILLLKDTYELIGENNREHKIKQKENLKKQLKTKLVYSLYLKEINKSDIMEKIYYKIIKNIKKKNKKKYYKLIVSILPIFDKIGYSIIDMENLVNDIKKAYKYENPEIKPTRKIRPSKNKTFKLN